MNEVQVRVVDLARWFTGDVDERLQVADDINDSLGELGFVVVTNHGVDPAGADAVRGTVGRLLDLPVDAKQPYEVPALGFPGWVPFGIEANGYIFGEETPPDLKESWVTNMGQIPGADGGARGHVVGTNVWPAELPELEPTVLDYIGQVERLNLELLAMLAVALGLDERALVDRCSRAASTFVVNWYPPLVHTGPVADNQYRIGPHTDFGSITILDRQPGLGGLQIQTAAGDWVDAPWVAGSLVINAGDLLEMWSGGRWRSARHRVLPPDADAPDESLMSLVFFCEPDGDVMIEPLIDGDSFEPVRASDYLQSKLDQITV
jgi:isopenicillin N synthase-like dioxygenase